MSDFSGTASTSASTSTKEEATPEGILEQVMSTLLEETPKIDVAAKNFIAYYVGNQAASSAEGMSFTEGLRIIQSLLRHLQSTDLLPLNAWLDAVPQGDDQTGIDRIDQVAKYKVIYSLRKRIEASGTRVSKTFGLSYFVDTNIWPRVRAACLAELGGLDAAADMLDAFERSFTNTSGRRNVAEDLHAMVWSTDFNAVLRDRRERRVAGVLERANSAQEEQTSELLETVQQSLSSCTTADTSLATDGGGASEQQPT
jgi:hypothetical protein